MRKGRRSRRATQSRRHRAPVRRAALPHARELGLRALRQAQGLGWRVIGKAEITHGEKNPRFIVTDIARDASWAKAHAPFAGARGLYEEIYCARADMENRIKEQQLDMFSDRTSTAFMSSNQLRLWFSTFAYLLMNQLRSVALVGTHMARATVGTIRLHLMKIAAQVNVSVRWIYVEVDLCAAIQRLPAAGSLCPRARQAAGAERLSRRAEPAPKSPANNLPR